MSCVVVRPPTSTVVNPETFPQQLSPSVPPVPSELPPPPTENRAFVTVDGIAQYKIGPGDVLDVFVTKGPTQDRIQTPVRANGRIVVNFAEVRVEGLTVDQAAAELTQALTVYFRHPQVEIQVKEYNSKKVSVLGAVGGTPRGGVGSVTLTGRMTITEFIARAGGLQPNASMERIRVTRDSGKAYTVNMYRYVQDGDLSQEFILDSGDVVFVPERAPGEERRIFLLGEVRTPGPVPFYPTLTLGQLVAQAGGWTDAARYDEARIIRADVKATEIIEVDLGRLMLEGDRRIDQFLQPNDVIYIPRTRIANWNAVLAQLRPTLEFISLALQPVILYRTIK
jgi:polysaccharide export outer membrane protein